MELPLVTILSAATTVAALGVSGCSGHSQPGPAMLTVAPPTVPAQPADPGPLPAPEALADVIYRLAEPTVAGPDKLPLVQNPAPADAATLDRFATALLDTGFAPITVTATDLRWSPNHPGDVLATVKITGTGTGTGTGTDKPEEFAFPMEFDRNGPGWQLTRETADMLLSFGNTRAAIPPPPPATSPPP